MNHRDYRPFGDWTGTWATAVAAGKAQAYFTYRQNNIYKYAATPDLGMHDTALRQNRSYWVKINEAGGGNLSMPGAGGSLTGKTYQWNNLRFTNGTDEKSITEAVPGAWVFSMEIVVSSAELQTYGLTEIGQASHQNLRR